MAVLPCSREIPSSTSSPCQRLYLHGFGGKEYRFTKRFSLTYRLAKTYTRAQFLRPSVLVIPSVWRQLRIQHDPLPTSRYAAGRTHRTGPVSPWRKAAVGAQPEPEHGVSISTVQQAYQLLEQQQMIVPQPRSGYFVARAKPSRRCRRCRVRSSARWRSPSGIRC